MTTINACPNCNGNNIFINKNGISGGGYAANYLPGLGGVMYHANLYPTICGNCGLVRMFVDDDAKSKLESSAKWERL